MESIAPKERFYPCPYCDCSISSNSPKCDQCGLEVSNDGIDELVRTEEARKAAIIDAVSLRSISIIFVVSSFFTNFVLTANNPLVIILLEGWFITLGAFIWKLIRWHQTHSQSYFELEILAEAKKEKNKAIFIFLMGLCVVIFSIWINL